MVARHEGARPASRRSGDRRLPAQLEGRHRAGRRAGRRAVAASPVASALGPYRAVSSTSPPLGPPSSRRATTLTCGRGRPLDGRGRAGTGPRPPRRRGVGRVATSPARADPVAREHTDTRSAGHSCALDVCPARLPCPTVSPRIRRARGRAHSSAAAERDLDGSGVDFSRRLRLRFRLPNATPRGYRLGFQSCRFALPTSATRHARGSCSPRRRLSCRCG